LNAFKILLTFLNIEYTIELECIQIIISGKDMFIHLHMDKVRDKVLTAAKELFIMQGYKKPPFYKLLSVQES